jgi:hypothetical protein
MPAHVTGTGFDVDPGVPRINFEDPGDDRLQEISWEESFWAFDQNKTSTASTRLISRDLA